MMKSSIILLLVTVTLAVPAYAQYDWHYYNGHLYALTLNWQPWVDNEAEAIATGGHLATVNDEAENMWLVNQFAYTFSRDHYGEDMQAGADIGFHHNSASGDWEWISGEPVTYTKLSSFFPQGGTKANLHVIPQPYLDYAWNANPLQTEPGGNPGFLYKGIIERSTVPEPSSILAMLAGIGSFIGFKRNR